MFRNPFKRKPKEPVATRPVSRLCITMKNGKVLSWQSAGALPDNYKVGPAHATDGPWEEFYCWFQEANEDSIHHFYSNSGTSYTAFRYSDIARINETIEQEPVLPDE